MLLRNTPGEITEPGTPFTPERMNNIEEGIEGAHEAIASQNSEFESKFVLIHDFADASNLASSVEGYGRDLMKLLLGHGIEEMTTQSMRNEAIAQVMAEIRRRCNNNGEIDNSGIPDFRGLMVGDYLDGLDLSDIAAAPGGTSPQAWNNNYRNNRIVIGGFNFYKGIGDTENDKNHILFIFRNNICMGYMRSDYVNTGGYLATSMRVWLEGSSGDGSGPFATGLKVALGGNYLYKTRKYLSRKNETRSWDWYTIYLATEPEVLGYPAKGDEVNPAFTSVSIQIPIYKNSFYCHIKKLNGIRFTWWTSTPTLQTDALFVVSAVNGGASQQAANRYDIGISPVFCCY